MAINELVEKYVLDFGKEYVLLKLSKGPHGFYSYHELVADKTEGVIYSEHLSGPNAKATYKVKLQWYNEKFDEHYHENKVISFKGMKLEVKK